MKLTVTDVDSLITTEHVVLVPEHPPPLHDANLQPEAGVAVRTTVLPLSNSAFVVPLDVNVIPLATDWTPPFPI